MRLLGCNFIRNLPTSTAGAQAVPRSQNHFLSSGADSVSAVILETFVQDQPQFGTMVVCACVEEESFIVFGGEKKKLALV